MHICMGAFSDAYEAVKLSAACMRQNSMERLLLKGQVLCVVLAKVI